MKTKLIKTLTFLLPLGAQATKHNVVVIYADDLGFGDVSCYNPDGKIITENIDKLASEGMRFIDAHSPSSISGPSRYALMTGRYAWRSDIKRNNPSTGVDLWVDRGRKTIASMFKDKGYNTAALGKWGLGGNWSEISTPKRKGLSVSAEAIDYSKPLPGALEIGFTYENIHRWFGNGGSKYKAFYPDYAGKMQSDGARWYFENGYSRDGAPQFETFDMREAQMYFISQTVEYIRACGGKTSNPKFNIKKDAPFFVYYAPHIPHLPLVPDKQFQGKSQVGIYGDFILQLDWAVGQIVKALEDIGQKENTIIVFSSDNGPEAPAYTRINEFKHRSMGQLRGVKRDLFQGGHNVPFIISYSGFEKKGVVSDRLISQTDLYATFADMLGYNLTKFEAEDSYSFLDELDSAKQVKKKREMAVHHSSDGKLALRQGDWVFVMSDKANSTNEPQWFRDELGVENKEETPFLLYNLKTDPRQKINLYNQNREQADKMQKALFSYVFEGRTR